MPVRSLVDELFFGVQLTKKFHPSTVDLDAWDGYRANRARVLNHLYNNSIDNTIILSGDSHANWVSDLARKFIKLHHQTS